MLEIRQKGILESVHTSLIIRTIRLDNGGLALSYHVPTEIRFKGKPFVLLKYKIALKIVFDDKNYQLIFIKITSISDTCN